MMEYTESLIQQHDYHPQNCSGTFDLQFQFVAHLVIKTDALKLRFYSIVWYLDKEKSYFFFINKLLN